jgi:hypothetical protein
MITKKNNLTFSHDIVSTDGAVCDTCGDIVVHDVIDSRWGVAYWASCTRCGWKAEERAAEYSSNLQASILEAQKRKSDRQQEKHDDGVVLPFWGTDRGQ